MEDKTASATVGPKGPIVLQDFTLIDELAHFDRERIPERVVHAKGAGKVLGTIWFLVPCLCIKNLYFSNYSQ